MSNAVAKRLEGKTILITGASSGIGKSTAQEFARTAPKNLKLILTARRIDSLKQLAADINKEVGEGVQVLPVQLDVSKPDEVAQLVQNLPKEFQQIDVLVNNAGLVRGVDKAGDIKTEDLDVMFATNVTGLINVTQAVLPQMKARGESGAGDIINVGSIAGREPYPGGSIYCATKAAVRSFTDAMRKELIATRIRVIEIDPGQVETEFSVVRFYGDKSKADAVYAGCEPLTPDDIAEIVVFTAGRRENVVIADTLVFPNHQVSCSLLDLTRGVLWLTLNLFQGGGYCLAQEVIMSASWSDLSTRRLLQFCIRSLRARRSCRYAFTSCTYVYTIHVHDLENRFSCSKFVVTLPIDVMCFSRDYLAVMSSNSYPSTSTDPRAAYPSSSCPPNPDAPWRHRSAHKSRGSSHPSYP
jgi:3-hydroxy acid dehydrogenase/malonic semialdehyde reductase